MTPSEFVGRIERDGLKMIDRAIALLWWEGLSDPTIGLGAAEVCLELERAGHARQNVTRMAAALKAHPGTVKAAEGIWRLHQRARRDLDAQYRFALEPTELVETDSVLPRLLFSGTRTYMERVTDQINKSYDAQLWDCCTVMCRRLLETLIIETYEKLGRAGEIKGGDGHFMMLNGLIAFLERDSSINLGRNAAKGLRDFKQLGDLSAHNRRFNACRNDIDRVRDGLRVASEELLHLAGLRS
jgi:hypothetical protein